MRSGCLLPLLVVFLVVVLFSGRNEGSDGWTRARQPESEGAQVGPPPGPERLPPPSIESGVRVNCEPPEAKRAMVSPGSTEKFWRQPRRISGRIQPFSPKP